MLTNNAKTLLRNAFNEYCCKLDQGITHDRAITFADSELLLDGLDETAFESSLQELERAEFFSTDVTGDFVLLSAGIAFAENGYQEFTPPVASAPNVSFNIQNANAPIAANMNASTVSSHVEITNNIGASLEQLEKIIRAKPTQDQALLMEMLQALQEVNDSPDPVPKTLLAKFSDAIKKHTDLLAPLGTALINVFAHG